MTNIFKKAAALSLSFLMLLPLWSNADTKKYHDKFAKSVIVSDFDTGRVLYEKNSNKKSAMASMSKIMTMLLTFDAIKQKKVSLSDVVIIKNTDVNRDGSNIKLNNGDKITLDQLLHGLMIVSGNDAALAISRHVSGSENAFVKRMNEKAIEIGMKNTIFYNPNGLPENINGKVLENTTTAKDVLTLTKWVYKHYPYETIKITDSAKYVDKVKSIDEANTNPLIPLIPNVDGLKTGFTPKAGYCLAFSMVVPKGNGNEYKNRFLGVTMGSPDKNARKLSAYNTLTFINDHYKTIVVHKANTEITKAPINGNTSINCPVVAHKDILAVKRINEKLTSNFVYEKLTIGNISKKPIGKIFLKNSSGAIVSRGDLYLDKSNFGIWDNIKLYLSAAKSSIIKKESNGNFPVISL